MPAPSPPRAAISQLPEALARAIDLACGRIAPTFPLDRLIAVNPFWGFLDATPADVGARLGELSGARLVMPRSYFREAWREGRLRSSHLQDAVDAAGSPRTVEQLVAALEQDPPTPRRRAQVTDVLDAQRDARHVVAWRDHVVHAVSQLCASYFDRGQASLCPDRDGGLYATFRRRAIVDRTPSRLMGMARFTALAAELPEAPLDLLTLALADLDVTPDEHESYLLSLLLDVNGWASWCAYLRWTARLEGRDDDTIVDLLAVRLAWEWLLLRSGGQTLAAKWQLAMAAWRPADEAADLAHHDDWLFQAALEIAYREPLTTALLAHAPRPAPPPPQVQAVFCIDVRSEVFRRALEAASPTIQTLGFAGFFGLPVEYRGVGSAATSSHLPGLLAPRYCVTDSGVADEVAPRRQGRLGLAGAWKQLRSGPLSGFAFVEALGLAYGIKLVTDSLGLTRPATPPNRAGLEAREHQARKPRLTGRADGAPVPVAEKVELAASILRGMSLTRGFARLVLFVGHGSQTANNPHASGLDCGACSGQTGEVNARAAAGLLNEPEVRRGLTGLGISIPASTRFVPALHDTTTDEVTLFDLDELPPELEPECDALRRALEEAGHHARAERAPRLGLAPRPRDALLRAMRRRARDWAEVRPEWGLTGNASFIAAPRERTRGLNLEGRAFLHDYRWQEDPEFAVLEQILTAPVVVAHWINFQYFASTVDPDRYGSGSKLLHNVVGGSIGVFEGNGGDLRIGLPWQSLHDGRVWAHAPLRLVVYVEAPRAAIDAIVERHDVLRRLVHNEWLHLFHLDPEPRSIHAVRRRSAA